MVKKLTITDVFRTDKDKQGNILKSKEGKPYTRVLIKSQEYGDQLLSGFGNKTNETWKPGDEVTLEITEVKKEDKTFYNFAPVNMNELMMGMIQDLKREVNEIKRKLEKNLVYPESKGEPDFDIVNAEMAMAADENIPF